MAIDFLDQIGVNVYQDPSPDDGVIRRPMMTGCIIAPCKFSEKEIPIGSYKGYTGNYDLKTSVQGLDSLPKAQFADLDISTLAIGINTTLGTIKINEASGMVLDGNIVDSVVTVTDDLVVDSGVDGAVVSNVFSSAASDFSTLDLDVAKKITLKDSVGNPFSYSILSVVDDNSLEIDIDDSFEGLTDIEFQIASFGIGDNLVKLVSGQLENMPIAEFSNNELTLDGMFEDYSGDLFLIVTPGYLYNVQDEHSYILVTSGLAPRGQIVATYSADRKDLSGIKVIQTTEDAKSIFGESALDDPDNKGAYGCAKMVNAIGGEESFFYLPINDEEESSWAGAIDLLNVQKGSYFIVPLTHDENVRDMFMSYVESVSKPENRWWSVLIWNQRLIYKTVKSSKSSGTFTKIADEYRLFDSEVDFIENGVQPGDYMNHLVGTSETGRNYILTKVSTDGHTITIAPNPNPDASGTEAYLDDLDGDVIEYEIIDDWFRTAPDGSVTTTDRYKQAVALYNYAKGLMKYRVWMDYTGTLDAGDEVVPGYYMSCTTAGLAIRTIENRPLSKMVATGFRRALGTTGYFTEREMSIVASGGICVIGQEYDGGPLVYMNQYTTYSIEQRFLFRSMVRNRDSIAMLFSRTFGPLMGRELLTDKFIERLRNLAQSLLARLMATEQVGVRARVVDVRKIDEAGQRDRIYMKIDLDEIYPANILDIYI